MNSYKELAHYDMRSAMANYKFELWNKVGRECQQACEKYIKQYLQDRHMLSIELARTHNLKKLIRVIPGCDKEVYRDLSVLGDYYFDANYPGDNFIELDKEMAEEAISIANGLFEYIDGLE